MEKKGEDLDFKVSDITSLRNSIKVLRDELSEENQATENLKVQF